MSEPSDITLEMCVGANQDLDLADYTTDPGSVTQWIMHSISAGIEARDYGLPVGTELIAITPQGLTSSVVNITAIAEGTHATTVYRIMPDNLLAKITVVATICAEVGPCCGWTGGFQTLIGAS